MARILHHRDTMIRPFALLLSILAASTAAPPARAEAVGADVVSALYSDRFAFDRRGVPLINVRVMEGQTRVTLSAPHAVRLMPYGSAATSVDGVKSWIVVARHTRPARIRYWVIVEKVAKPASPELQAERVAHWRRRGLAVQTMEVGAIFAVGGRLVDNRSTLVVARATSTRAAAERGAARVQRTFGVPTRIHEELLARPRGEVVARPQGPKYRRLALRVASGEVAYFAAQGGRGLLRVHRVEYGRGYRWHGHADRRYYGRVIVTIDRLGKLAVINEVPADQLLFGLVPAEIYTAAPIEALKAQAVAARGQLLAKIGTRHTGDPYPICSAQHCQVYSGAGSEHRRTTAAVQATRGRILVSKLGRLTDTVYSASCGGYLENNESVWNTPPDPHLRGGLDVPDAARFGLRRFAARITNENIADWLGRRTRSFCARASRGVRGRFRWRVTLAQARLDRLVARRLDVGSVRRLEVLSRGRSGRATGLKVHGSRGAAVVRGELRIRRLLGNLKSSMFVVTRRHGVRGTRFEFRGGGWGHGVGMCQTGAIGMAEARHGLGDILGHYYPAARLVSLY